MSFLAHCLGNGITPRDIIADGKIHRCPTNDHLSKKNGAYMFDGKWGWCMNWAEHQEPVIYGDSSNAIKPSFQEIRIKLAQINNAYEQAAKRAAAHLAACKSSPHPYLSSKGFSKECGMIDAKDNLIIPMRSITGHLQSLQIISGLVPFEKKFMHGGKASGAVFALGTPIAYAKKIWLCEGYATGLSLLAALKVAFAGDCVVVCFSAGNMVKIAQILKHKNPCIMADNDTSKAGETAAQKTGLSYVMPPESDTDANDYHQAQGLLSLARLVKEVK